MPHYLSSKYAVLLLLLVTILVFANTFANSWSYDDIPVVVENPDSKSLDGFLANTRPGRPMRELSYIPEYILFGDNPAGYHTQQLFWHAANGCLLFYVFTALGLAPTASMLAALFFLVHPLQAESVANISHRKELLALFFSLVTFICYTKAVSASKTASRIFWLLPVFVGYAAVLWSNETAITLPVILIAYDFLFLSATDRIIAKRPLLLVTFCIIASALIFYHYRGLFASGELLNVYSKNSFIATRSYIPLWMADLKVFVLYLSKIILPLDLAPEYHISFSEELLQPVSLFGGVILVATIYACLTLRTKRPLISFGIISFLAFYIPISNVIPISYMMADRYMYLCLPGIALLTADILHSFSHRLFKMIVMILLLSFSTLTIIQNSYWKDEHTLWRHAVKVNPDSTWVQETAALSYLLADDFQSAALHAEKALELNRFNTRAYLTLAKAQDRLGNLGEALKNYERFVNYGRMEFPQEVAVVSNYLPLMRKRVFIWNQ